MSRLRRLLILGLCGSIPSCSTLRLPASQSLTVAASPPKASASVAAGVQPSETRLPETVSLRSQEIEMHGSWYFPPGPGTFATLLVLPGGRGRGQVGVAWPQYHWTARAMSECGLAVFVLDYSSDRREPFDPRTVQDIGVAVEHVKQRPGVRPNAIFLVGFSLGGSNALRVAGSRSDLAGVITYFAPADWRVGKTHSPGVVVRQPIEYVAGLTVPLLILQGDADQITDVEQARLLERTAAAQGKKAELVIYEGAGHGFTFKGAPEGPCCRFDEKVALRSFDAVAEFVKRHVFP